jgi:hypothetical protein
LGEYLGLLITDKKISMPESLDHITTAIIHAKFKVEWAKNHINGIEYLIKEMTSAQGYIVKPYNDAQSGTYRLYIGPKDGIPAGLPLHIGDAIHNLNSVMDFLWSGLARSVNSEIASKITFPRDEKRENLAARLSRGIDASINQEFSQAKSFILDIVKPYKRADGLIWSLNKLDNINKHRMLIATTNIIGFKRDLVVQSEDGSIVCHSANATINTSGPNLVIGFATPFTVNDDFEPTIGVIFGERDHFSGEPILATVIKLVEAVEDVIQSFEANFL